MLLFLDNFDSFSFNLIDYFNQEGVECDVRRNTVSVESLRDDYSGIVLSPGPGQPQHAGNLIKVIERYHLKIPILGICLGHQAIGTFFGSGIKKGIKPMHGKLSRVICDPDPIFQGIPQNFNVVRYHSLVIDRPGDSVKPIAVTEENEIMAIRHIELPIYGLQYHPEAVLTEFGKEILKNWIFLHKIVH